MNIKIIVLGCTGMLGHVLFKFLNTNKSINVLGVCRNNKNLNSVFNQDQIKKIQLLNSLDFLYSLDSIISKFNPDVVINCIGVIKQSRNIKNVSDTIIVNSKLPHEIAYLLKTKYKYTKLIQISTDCVFNGNKGNYDENSIPNSNDLYGISKLLGEVTYDNHLTFRTSIIGPEINKKNSLFEWFLSKNKLNGYSNAFFSGFTTLEFAKIISYKLKDLFYLNGLYHISSNKISKFDLLTCINNTYNLNKKIINYDKFNIDRSLNSKKFSLKIDYKKKSWKRMLKEQSIEYDKL